MEIHSSLQNLLDWYDMCTVTDIPCGSSGVLLVDCSRERVGAAGMERNKREQAKTKAEESKRDVFKACCVLRHLTRKSTTNTTSWCRSLRPLRVQRNNRSTAWELKNVNEMHIFFSAGHSSINYSIESYYSLNIFIFSRLPRTPTLCNVTCTVTLYLE